MIRIGGAVFLALLLMPPAAAEAPTYAADVAPIVHTACVACHHPDGSAPFPLTTWEEVRRRGRQIVEVTESGYMPPWLPAAGYGSFQGERRLTAEQVRTLRAWWEAEAPLGGAAPPAPRPPSGWSLGEPDLVLELADPFPVPADGQDLFRNFVIGNPMTSPRYVRAVELRPGNPRVVHHALIHVDGSPSSRLLDQQDPGPGYDGMQFGESDFPDGHFLGWTPGKAPRPLPQGLTFTLHPGDDLVLQFHLFPTGKAETLEPQLGLYFADEPGDRESRIIGLGSRQIDIAPGDANWGFTDSYTLPVEVDLVSVYPHAHYLGRSMNAWAILPDGSQTPIIRIDRWDFNWQDQYLYDPPVRLPSGSRIEIEYRYDNSAANPRNPHDPPRRVSYGFRTTDEMGDLVLQVIPADRESGEILETDFRTRRLAVERGRLEAALANDPDSPTLLNSLGLRLLEQGHPDDAMVRFQQALAVDEDFEAARVNLGVALYQSDRRDDAATTFRQVLTSNPSHASAHLNLANTLFSQRNLEESLRHYQEAVQSAPFDAEAHLGLGTARRALGDIDGAITSYRESVRLRPGSGRGHYNLGNALIAKRDFEAAIAAYRRATSASPRLAEAHQNLGLALSLLGRDSQACQSFQAAVRLRPDWPPPRYKLAFLLATSPAEACEAPARALEHAELAAELTGYADARALDALGAAYAAGGRFEEASLAAQQALLYARDPDLARQVKARLALYRQGRPYVATPER